MKDTKSVHFLNMVTNRKVMFFVIALFFCISYSIIVFAVAPIGGYTPGQTLDPDCAPGDTDCLVQISGGSSLSFDGPLVESSGIVSIPVANSGTDGYLSTSDWNTFNSKQNALTFGSVTASSNPEITITGGTGAVIGTGLDIIIPDASDTVRGLVTTGAQNFAGIKNFVDGLGIGDASPSSLFSVGTGGLFQVDNTGDLVKIKNISYTWPSAQAAGSGYVLTNDGAGGLSWSTGLSIGGTSGQLQYNNAGSLGGVSGVTYDGTNFDAKDSVFRIVDNSDTTKRAIFEVSGIDTGTTRTYTFPNTAGTLALTSDIANYTFSTGLTNTSGTITNNLSTGVSGGQSIYGGTASGNNLTLYSTSNATKGKILFGTSAYDEVNNYLGVGTASPSASLHVLGTGDSSPIFKIESNTTAHAYPQMFDVVTNDVSSDPSLRFRRAGTGNGDFSFMVSGSSHNYLSIFSSPGGARTYRGQLTIAGNGSGIGIGTTGPTALLHITAGTATANTAPLKFTSGTNLTTPEAGVMEYDGTSLFFTPSSTRYNVLMNGLGLAGGQTIVGGTASGNNLTLSSTSNATKGKILFGTSAYDELNNYLGIGTITPSSKLNILTDSLGSTQTSTAGLLLQNSTVSTVGSQKQISPAIEYEGTSYFGGSNNIVKYRTYNLTGNNGADSDYAIWTLGSKVGTGAWSDNLLAVYTDGRVGINGLPSIATGTKLNVNGNAVVGTASGTSTFSIYTYLVSSVNAATNETTITQNIAGGYLGIGANSRKNDIYINSITTGSVLAGNIGFGGVTSPTAKLHLPAGSATASSAPIKFTSGTNLTTPEAGAMEYSGAAYYGTVAGPSRYNFVQNNLGFVGGQTIIGDTAASGNLTLSSTSNATKGKILFGTSAYDEVSNRLGIGTNSPTTPLDVRGNATFGTAGVPSLVTVVGDASNTALRIGNSNSAFYYDIYREGLATGLLTFQGNQSGATGYLFKNETASGKYFTFSSAGRFGINVLNPTASLQLPAGTATASTAPLKFTSGTNLATPEAGAFEYDGSSLFFTRSGTLRAGLLMTDTASPFNTYSQSAKGATAFTSGTDNFLGGQLAGGALTAGSQNVMIGTQAGNLANAGLSQAVFLGYFAGQSASGITTGSVFVGSQAGQNGAGSYNSNFIGQLAGFNASSAYHSNLFGYQAGYGISANNVNFFGQNAGYGATLANDTVGIGQNAGRNATGSIESIYLGKNTGYNSTGSGITGDYNIIVGSESGRNLTSGGKNILIGYNLNAQSAATDGQMTIGNLLFGTGIDGTGTTVSTGKIGIGTASPSYRFSVSDTTTAGIVGSFTNSDGTCTLDPGDVSGWSCPSDLNLKKDIETLATGSLDNILALRPVTYRLKNENGSIDPSTGLIAQEVQTIFPKLVKTQIDGTLALNYGGLTPYMISAIQEMNLRITEINDTEKPNSWRDALIGWFGNITNGITDLYAKVFHAERVETQELCVGTTCLNETQVQQILQVIGSTPLPVNNPGGPITDPNLDPGNTTDSGDGTATDPGTSGDSGTPPSDVVDPGSSDPGVTPSSDPAPTTE